MQQLQDAERAKAAQQAAQAEAEARSRAARAEEDRLAAERVAAAAHLRDLERSTAAAADRVAGLVRRQQEAEARLQRRAEDMRPLLPVMERLALYPAETLLAVPLPPQQAVRGLLVLGAVSRQLEQDAVAVRAEQAEVRRLRREAEVALPHLRDAEAAQARAAQQLDAQLGTTREQRVSADDDAAQAARRAAAAAERADTLKAALARLEAERRAEEEKARHEAERAARHQRLAEAAAARRREEALARPAGPGLDQAHGRLAMPVAGRITRGWAEAGGAATGGVTLTAASGARVVSPCTGRVVFAHPFRSYGNLLIVDCGGGFHAVLAGLQRFDVQSGNSVRQGEPVGVMGNWDAAAGGSPPGLYFELRKGGQPVDPTPYLRASS